MTWRDARGQTTTEFLMISGFITSFAIFVLDFMGVPLQMILQILVRCIINERCA